MCYDDSDDRDFVEFALSTPHINLFAESIVAEFHRLMNTYPPGTIPRFTVLHVLGCMGFGAADTARYAAAVDYFFFRVHIH